MDKGVAAHGVYGVYPFFEPPIFTGKLQLKPSLLLEVASFKDNSIKLISGIVSLPDGQTEADIIQNAVMAN